MRSPATADPTSSTSGASRSAFAGADSPTTGDGRAARAVGPHGVAPRQPRRLLWPGRRGGGRALGEHPAVPLQIGRTVAAPIADVLRVGPDRRPGLARLPDVGVDVVNVDVDAVDDIR